MNKSEIKQDHLASSLMSSTKAAFQYYYDKELSDSMMFGLTGHAFVTHTTNGLGPCAPYTWDMKPFNELSKKALGLDMFGGFNMVTSDSDDNTKKSASDVMKNILNRNLVLLCSYEFQLITELKDEMFITTLPWGDAPSETPNMEENTFNGMKEFMSFFEISKTNKTQLDVSVKDSIKYAISLFEDPNPNPDSGFGIHAFDFWLEKVNDDNVQAHGNWWTSSVWAESRKMASLYMQDIKPIYNQDAILSTLSELYTVSSELFSKVSDKEVDKDTKIKLVKQLKENELHIYKHLKELK